MAVVKPSATRPLPIGFMSSSFSSGREIFWAAIRFPKDFSEPQTAMMKNGTSIRKENPSFSWFSPWTGKSIQGAWMIRSRLSKASGWSQRARSQPDPTPRRRQYILTDPFPQILVPTMTARATAPTQASCQQK